jgi:hypothetical protein
VEEAPLEAQAFGAELWPLPTPARQIKHMDSNGQSDQVVQAAHAVNVSHDLNTVPEVAIED